MHFSENEAKLLAVIEKCIEKFMSKQYISKNLDSHLLYEFYDFRLNQDYYSLLLFISPGLPWSFIYSVTVI